MAAAVCPRNGLNTTLCRWVRNPLLWLNHLSENPCSISQQEPSKVCCTAPTTSPASTHTPGCWASPLYCQVLPRSAGATCQMCTSPMWGQREDPLPGKERDRKGTRKADMSHLDFSFLIPSVSHQAVWTSQSSPPLGDSLESWH